VRVAVVFDAAVVVLAVCRRRLRAADRAAAVGADRAGDDARADRRREPPQPAATCLDVAGFADRAVAGRCDRHAATAPDALVRDDDRRPRPIMQEPVDAGLLAGSLDPRAFARGARQAARTCP